MPGELLPAACHGIGAAEEVFALSFWPLEPSKKRQPSLKAGVLEAGNVRKSMLASFEAQ